MLLGMHGEIRAPCWTSCSAGRTVDALQFTCSCHSASHCKRIVLRLAAHPCGAKHPASLTHAECYMPHADFFFKSDHCRATDARCNCLQGATQAPSSPQSTQATRKGVGDYSCKSKSKFAAMLRKEANKQVARPSTPMLQGALGSTTS